MGKIAIYTLTSELHDEQAVDRSTQAFLGSIAVDFDFKGSDYADYGSHALDLIYVRTGGTEGIFKQLLPQLQQQSQSPFFLLTSGKSNSLAASMEILSFLRQNGMRGEILHGQPQYIVSRMNLLVRVGEARRQLRNCRLGILGAPSDWLISSDADKGKVWKSLGITLLDIPMNELVSQIATTPLEPSSEKATTEQVTKALSGAQQIYKALRSLVERHELQGFTLRCFDLLTAVRNTGCLALARLNAEGFVAGCEGDVPAMLSMMIARALTGKSGFQANPASIDPETGEILFAHCTIPLDMTERYELDTHFESGIGVGIRGYVKEGPVTLFKVSGDLSRYFVAEGQLLGCQSKPDLCRTQMVVRLKDASVASYFLTNPIGNHHIVLTGHHADLLKELVAGATSY